MRLLLHTAGNKPLIRHIKTGNVLNSIREEVKYIWGMTSLMTHDEKLVFGKKKKRILNFLNTLFWGI